jgi:hypothetical protein
MAKRDEPKPARVRADDCGGIEAGTARLRRRMCPCDLDLFTRLLPVVTLAQPFYAKVGEV